MADAVDELEQVGQRERAHVRASAPGRGRTAAASNRGPCARAAACAASTRARAATASSVRPSRSRSAGESSRSESGAAPWTRRHLPDTSPRADCCTSPLGGARRPLEPRIARSLRRRRTQASSGPAGSSDSSGMEGARHGRRFRATPAADIRASTRAFRCASPRSRRTATRGRDGPTSAPRQETCSNLSRGGVFVRTGELLEPGRRVLVELSLPNGSQVEAIGRVAWTKRTLEKRRAPSSTPASASNSSAARRRSSLCSTIS